jgi:hypothetical protein
MRHFVLRPSRPRIRRHAQTPAMVLGIFRGQPCPLLRRAGAVWRLPRVYTRDMAVQEKGWFAVPAGMVLRAMSSSSC